MAFMSAPLHFSTLISCIITITTTAQFSSSSPESSSSSTSLQASVDLFFSLHSSLFSINISTSSSASVPTSIYTILPSYFLQLMTLHYKVPHSFLLSESPHSKQSTAPPSKLCLHDPIPVWIFLFRINLTSLTYLHGKRPTRLPVTVRRIFELVSFPMNIHSVSTNEI